MKRISRDRMTAHLDRGGRVFLPQSRMRGIRWEESVARSHMRRERTVGSLDLVSFSCGIECHGLPFSRAPLLAFASRNAGGTITVDAPGRIVAARVKIEHPAPVTLAVRLVGPTFEVQWVSRAPGASRSRIRDVGYQARGPAAGTYRLTALDGERDVPVHWSLTLDLRA